MSRRRITTLLAATVLVPVLAIALGLLAVAQPASAHGDDGAIEVVSVTVAAPLSLRVEANITFVGDGHAAPEATATVVAERAGAPAVGPVTLNASGPTGRYSATITLPSPGEWTLRLTSLSPTAVVERRETVTQPPTTTTVAVATTTGVAVTTTVAQSPTTTAGGPGPLTSTVAPTTTRDTSSGGDESDENHVATTLVFVGVLVAIAVLATLAVRSARRSRGSSGPA